MILCGTLTDYYRLVGFWQGRKTIVPFYLWKPEQKLKKIPRVKTPQLKKDKLRPYSQSTRNQCYLDEADTIVPPALEAYLGRPQGIPEPLFGSSKELGLRRDICYDRINRFGPYGAGYPMSQGGLGVGMDGDAEGIEQISKIDYRNISWGNAQKRCVRKNSELPVSKKAFVIRTWHDYDYTPYVIMMLRAMISELSIASGGEYQVHFLIDVRDDEIDIFESDEVHEKLLKASLPSEFEGMGTLWSMQQMKSIYPPPFPESWVNFSGGPLYSAYRSLHWAFQYFATQHPEYDYFWHWEMDLRVTGHYYEFLAEISKWAERQPSEYLWERGSKFYISKLFGDSYQKYGQSIIHETKAAKQNVIAGPQLAREERLAFADPKLANSKEAPHNMVDLITLNPLFDPERSLWAFRQDLTGYEHPPDAERPPTRASLITATRLSRRLLLQMHQETLQRKRTMFPEMFPAAIALQYGFKAVYAPIPIWMQYDWPARHADEVFNNAKISDEGYEMGMTEHGDGYFHGKDGSVFGPGEHVFRGATYYSNAAFAGDLWRTWLGRAGDRDRWEESPAGQDGGRMCLPMMILHPVKSE